MHLKKIIEYDCSKVSLISYNFEKTTCYDVDLNSGKKIENIKYYENEGSSLATLRLITDQGLRMSYNGKKVNSISKSEYEELVLILISDIYLNKKKKLESIDFSIGLLDSTWDKILDELTNTGGRYDNQIINSNNKLLTELVKETLKKDSNIIYLYDLVGFYSKGYNLSGYRIGLNPIPFNNDLALKKWKDAKSMGEFGIQKDIMWFSVVFE